MKLTFYKSVDEALNDFLPVFINHKGCSPLEWGVSKSFALQSFSDDYLEKINLALNAVDYDDVNTLQINPCQFAKTAFRYSVTSKSATIMNKPDRALISSNFLKLFNLGVARQIFVEKTVKQRINDMAFSLCPDFEFSRKLSFLLADIRALCEIIFCDEHTIGGQILGPYRINDFSLLIHNYTNLLPIDLLKVIEGFRFKRITVYVLYDDDSICADIIGNISRSANVIDTLRKFYIECELADGEVRVLQPEDVGDLILYLDNWILKTMSNYNKMSPYYKWKFALECEYYAVKPMLDLVPVPWSPIIDDSEANLIYSQSSRNLYTSKINIGDDDLGALDIARIAYEFIDPRH